MFRLIRREDLTEDPYRNGKITERDLWKHRKQIQNPRNLA